MHIGYVHNLYSKLYIFLFLFLLKLAYNINSNLSYCTEPNNDSPLNIQAAELWSNQTKYKKYLTEEYNRAYSRNSQDS